jgi:cytochrome c peroxidase
MEPVMSWKPLTALGLALSLIATTAPGAEPAPKVLLGERLFTDVNLSEPPGQACVSCHVDAAGFADPDSSLPVSRGVHRERLGKRNTPSAAYAGFAPTLHYDEAEGVWIGGLFLDGRAATLADQAKDPFLDPLEMANASGAQVVAKVRAADYAPLFEQVYGPGALDDDAQAFEYVADAIAAFERSPAMNPFSSKYDAYLAGEAQLSAQELRGLKLYEDAEKGNCAACHPSAVGEDGSAPLFTDFTYDNLGTPRHPELPFYAMPAAWNPDGAAFVDRGLGATLDDPAQDGKFKVPTLRNIALSAPYMHNGVFATLEEVMDFYNTRDVKDWPAPEIAANVNTEELGDLGLTQEEVDDIIAFMHTLTDGYRPAVEPAPE